MSICPNCKEEIITLNHYDKVQRKFNFEVIDGEPDYSNEKLLDDCSCDEWECPKCAKLLFDNEDSAVEFLK